MADSTADQPTSSGAQPGDPMGDDGGQAPPPPGAAFGLGWLMAELFGGRKERTEPSDHLPTVAELSDEHFLTVGVTELERLTDLLGLGLPADLQVGLKSSEVNGGSSLVKELHLDFLAALAGNQEQLHAYLLGRALRDTCWLVKDEVTLKSQLDSFRLATLQAWTIQAGGALPYGTGAVLRRSLEYWRKWLGERAARRGMGSPPTELEAAIHALRRQSDRWRALFGPGNPGTSLPLSAEAWEHACDELARSGKEILLSVVKHFWIALAVVLAFAVGLVVIEIRYASGATTVWSVLVTTGAYMGVTGASVRAGAKKAAQAVEVELTEAAKTSAQAWELTCLPRPPEENAYREKEPIRRPWRRLKSRILG